MQLSIPRTLPKAIGVKSPKKRKPRSQVFGLDSNGRSRSDQDRWSRCPRCHRRRWLVPPLMDKVGNSVAFAGIMLRGRGPESATPAPSNP